MPAGLLCPGNSTPAALAWVGIASLRIPPPKPPCGRGFPGQIRPAFIFQTSHKYQGLYYLSYSTGEAQTRVYATGESSFGPFTFRGRILNPVVGWTTRHSILEFGGKWRVYYHDASLSGGVNHKRCVKVQELCYEADGTIRTMDP